MFGPHVDENFMKEVPVLGTGRRFIPLSHGFPAGLCHCSPSSTFGIWNIIYGCFLKILM